MRVYLLIDTASGRAWSVAQLLRDKPGITFADAVTGPHSVIAILEPGNSETSANTGLEDIRAIEGVKYITSCFAIRARS